MGGPRNPSAKSKKRPRQKNKNSRPKNKKQSSENKKTVAPDPKRSVAESLGSSPTPQAWPGVLPYGEVSVKRFFSKCEILEKKSHPHKFLENLVPFFEANFSTIFVIFGTFLRISDFVSGAFFGAFLSILKAKRVPFRA